MGQQQVVDVSKYQELNCAASNGNIDLVAALLNQGAKSNANALSCATENRHLACMALLIDKGASVNTKLKVNHAKVTVPSLS